MSGPSHSATTLVHFNFSLTPPFFLTAFQYQLLLGPQQLSQAKRLHRTLHTLQKAKKSASGTMRDAAQGGRNASSHTSAGTQAARVSTLVKCVPNVLEFQRALTPYDTVNLTHLSMFANNALLGGGVRVRVWIREQRKIKRRSKVLLSL